MAADAIIAAVVSIIGCLTGLVTALAYTYKSLSDKDLTERISNHEKLKKDIEMVDKELKSNNPYPPLFRYKFKSLVEEVKNLKIEEEINKTCLFVVPDIRSRLRIGTLIVDKLKVVTDLMHDEDFKLNSRLTDKMPPPLDGPRETDAPTMKPAEEQQIKSTEDGAHAILPKEKDTQNVKPTAEQQRASLESKSIGDDAEKIKPTGFVAKVKEVWRKNKEKRGTGILAFVIGIFLIAGLFYLGFLGIPASVVSIIFLFAASFCLPNRKEKLKTLMEKKEELSKLICRLSNEPEASQWKDDACKLYEEVNEKELEEIINKNCQIECLPDIYSRLRIGRIVAQKIDLIKEELKKGESFITTSEKSISLSLSSRQCQASTTLVTPKTNDAIEEMWSWTLNNSWSTEIASMQAVEPGSVKETPKMEPINSSGKLQITIDNFDEGLH